AEPRQHRLLMRLAARDQVQEADVELLRWLQLTARREQVQPGEVLTGQEVGHVAGRQPQPAADELHRERSRGEGTSVIWSSSIAWLPWLLSRAGLTSLGPARTA